MRQFDLFSSYNRVMRNCNAIGCGPMQAVQNINASRWEQHKSESRNPKSDPLRRRDSAARRSPKPEIRRTNRLTSIPAFRASDFGFLSGFGIRASGFVPGELERIFGQRCEQPLPASGT
jgi:hypothetical protein